MKLTKYFLSILLISFCIVLNSCSEQQETPIKLITATEPPIPPAISTEHTKRYLYWQDNISRAESLWTSSKIDSYEVVGYMSWAWHEHSFQITVTKGEIDNSRCESNYDNYTNNNWCKTEFNANDYTIPALFKKSRELLNFGEKMGNPRDDCFSARFDFYIGVPTSLSFDCPQAHDEEEQWVIIFFNNMP